MSSPQPEAFNQQQESRSSRMMVGSLCLLGVSLIWGATFPILKSTLANFPPMYFCALRFSVAIVCMAPFIWARRSRFTLRVLFLGLGLGVFMFLGFLFQTYGLVYTSATNSAFLTGLLVVMVPLIQSLFLWRLPPLKLGVGVVLAVAGLYFLAGPVTLSMNKGDILSIICALAYSIHILWLASLSETHDVFLLTSIQFAVVLFLSGGAAYFTEAELPRDIPWRAVAFCGVFATALAFFVQMKYQRWVGATRAAMIFVTEPIWAALFSYFFVGEVLGLSGYLGASLMLIGLVIVEWPKRIRPL